MALARWAVRVWLRVGCSALLLGAAFAPTACGDDYDSCEATLTCATAATGGTAARGTGGSSGAGRGGAAGSVGGSGGTMGGTGGSTSGTGGSTEGAGGTMGEDSGPDASMGAGGGDGSVGADAGPDSFDPTVRGVLKSPAGFPVAGKTVAIGSTAVITDANGEFVITNAPPTYDLLILYSVQFGTKEVEAYVGLTTRRPTILLDYGDPAGRSTVEGLVNPPEAFPNGSSQIAKIAFHPSLAYEVDAEQVGETRIAPLEVDWPGIQTVTGQLYALQWTYTPGGYLPTGYQRWGTQPLALTAFATVSTSLQLGAATQAEISGVAHSPMPIDGINVHFWVGQIMIFSHNFVVQPNSTTIPYRFLVPTGLGQVPKHMRVTGAGCQIRVRLKDSVTAEDINLSPSPVVTLPVDAATNVDVNTEFSWSAVPDAVYTLKADSGNTTFTIHTAATRAKIPDTQTKGIPFAVGSYNWSIIATGPARGVDDLVNEATAPKKLDSYFTAASASRRFTAKGP